MGDLGKGFPRINKDEKNLAAKLRGKQQDKLYTIKLL